MRSISMAVNGAYITKDNENAGVQGEANVTKLVITFDESWDGLAKKCTWWDAKGENPVARTLTTDLADLPDNPRAYTVTIPGEPLAEAGLCTLVIDGYADGKRARTVSARFKVSQAPIAPNPSEPTDPTPSQAEQLQKQIDAIMEDIADAAAAADAKEAAQASADAAAASQEAAAGSATAAAASAGAAASSAGAAASSAATAGQSAQAAQEAQGKAELAQNAAEDARDAARGSASDAAASAELAGQYAVQAGQSASLAGQYAGQADQSAQAATDAANAAASAQQGAEQARQAIENLGVEGETLDPGQQVAVVKTVGADGAVTLTFKIPQGAKGETGETGAQGKTGPQGVSVTDAEVNQDGELILTLSNQQTVNAGHVVGPRGPQGGQGDPGSSVASVQRTQGTGAAGTTDTYTMYNEDGEAVGTFQVYNGTNGTGSGDFMADGSVPMTGSIQFSGGDSVAIGKSDAAERFDILGEGTIPLQIQFDGHQINIDGSGIELINSSNEASISIKSDSIEMSAPGGGVKIDNIYPPETDSMPVPVWYLNQELEDKQGKLTGSEGQVVGFDASGNAIAQDPPQTGMTQDQADQRYLKLSGGTMQGDVNFSAGEDPSMSRGVKFTVNMESAHLHGLNEGSGTMLEASDQMGELVRLRFAYPVASTDGATKGYVDGKAPLIVTVTETDGEYSADCTAYEIYQASLAGRTVYARRDMTDQAPYTLWYALGNAAEMASAPDSFLAKFYILDGRVTGGIINIGGNTTSNQLVKVLDNTTQAAAIKFTPGTTGLSADNVQDAIEEVMTAAPNNARPYANRYTLSSGGWSNQQYTMTVYGVNSDNTEQVVSISPDTEADWEAWVDAGVYCIGPNGVSNQLVFKCNAAPTANIALVIAIQEMKVYAS